MKRLFYLILILLLTLFGCINEKGQFLLPTANGEVEVQLIINNQNNSRASSRGSIETSPGSDEESALANTLLIYLFDENGVYEGHHEVQCTGRVTEVFRVTSGLKRIYIFSNPPAGYPVKTDALEDFETQIIPVTFNNDRPLIATDNQFFIQSLWREEYINIEHPTQQPGLQDFALKVGRAVAKIRLKSVDPVPAGTQLKGTFTDPYYTVKKVPTRHYLIGQYQGDEPPAANTQLFSAVHEEKPGTAATPNPVFRDYSFPAASNVNETDFFYAIENTTRRDAQTGLLYYGNTTHIHLKVQYLPDATTVLSGQDGVSQGTLPNDRTFWTASNKQGELKIYDSDPAALSGLAYITHYPQGWCHYYFPVTDPLETDEELRYCVIRNHFYDIEVNIAGLGTPDDTIDPETPIDEGIDVIISCQVEDWTDVDVDSGNIEF